MVGETAALLVSVDAELRMISERVGVLPVPKPKHSDPETADSALDKLATVRNLAQGVWNLTTNINAAL